MICNSWFDARSRVYGYCSEPGGEVGVTGWWQQMVDATTSKKGCHPIHGYNFANS